MSEIVFTKSHELYRTALRSKSVHKTIAYGSAGTSKTYTALEAGVEYAQTKGHSIVCLRPPVSFTEEPAAAIPGDEREKLEPWTRPIQQNLEKLGINKKMQMSWEKCGTLQYYPLEYVQGMTFDQSFILLDEAENTTFSQLRTIISRMGRWSKLVICGDVAQTSPYFRGSGLGELIRMVDTLGGNFNTIHFTPEDIVRSKECKESIILFEEWDKYKAGHKL